LERDVLCNQCHGKHFVEVAGKPVPCPECGGAGDIHCCDGLAEQPDMEHVLGPAICVIGSCNMDLTFQVARLPAPGETRVGHGFTQGFGGKGANQAVMAARLGARVTLVGCVGADAFGEAIRANLLAEGIDTRFLSSDPAAATGLAAITVDDAARNSIVVFPGANHALALQHIQQAEAILQSAAIVVAQMEVPIAVVIAAFRIARAAGVPTLLNPAPAPGVSDELLSLTDICVPNETELATLTGQEDPEAAAGALRSRGPSAVVVTLGEQGALVLDGAGADRLPAVSAAAIDSTGAGDAFCGTLAVCLAHGADLRESVQLANAVAARSVERSGAQASFPSRTELAAGGLFAKMKL
jgi:ribokinase